LVCCEGFLFCRGFYHDMLLGAACGGVFLAG
jgi:hypothetical protein